MWLVAFVMVAVYALGNVPAPLYEIYRREFGFSEVVLTLVYAAYVAGTVGAMFFAGSASDRAGRRPPVFISLAVGVVAAIVFLGATSTPWLFVARILTGLSVGVGTAAATAWIVELHPRNDRAAANRVALGGNLLGLALGPIVAGLMAAHMTSPLRLPYGFSLALLLVASLVAVFAKETKQTSKGLEETSLRPRLGVPRALRQDFIAAAIAAFATFAVLGFYSALIPSLLTRSLHIANHAVAGAIVGGLFLIALSATIVVPRIDPSRGMSYGLAALIPATIGLVAADRWHSLSLLIATTAVAGAAGGLGCLFGQQILNERAPEEQRAEVISVYLLVCYAGLSLPVVGVGILGSAAGPALAHLVFGAVTTLLAVAALLYEIFGRLRPSPGRDARRRGGPRLADRSGPVSERSPRRRTRTRSPASMARRTHRRGVPTRILGGTTMENDVMGQTSGSGNANSERGRIREDGGTRAMEQVTARAPSQVWLWLAGASMIGSVALFATGRRQGGIFVGLWPLTFLVIGNYNKIVKSLGST